MKKIGIITHYYNSNNYGGVLQAYALTKILNDRGYVTEQINYESNYKNKLKDYFKLPVYYKIIDIKRILILLTRVVFSLIKHSKIADYINIRKIAFVDFRINKIPHSLKVYNSENISSCVDDYDVFITGSDQVWVDFYYYINPYYLKFVPSEKIKMSYAASACSNPLTKRDLKYFKEILSDFDGVSVRENNTVDILQTVYNGKVSCNLDPTLLLTQEEWDSITSSKYTGEKYVFAYLLGKSKNQRKIITDFAKKKNLKIITLPNLLNMYRKCDDDFGDIQLYDVSPNLFLSLIKYSEYTFTDSFHATVFAGIFNKQYFVFGRDKNNPMGSRLVSLMNLYKTYEHYCDSLEKETLQYIENLHKIDYSNDLNDLQFKKEESIDYLINTIENSKK